MPLALWTPTLSYEVLLALHGWLLDYAHDGRRQGFPFGHSCVATLGLFFISPADGETVANPIKVEFGIEGMDVAKAGDNQPNSGHHHLLIDTGLPDLGVPIPADGRHIHFGDGSTSTEITLPPGQHTLCMLLGDHLHIPHDPPVVSESITITVE